MRERKARLTGDFNIIIVKATASSCNLARRRPLCEVFYIISLALPVLRPRNQQFCGKLLNFTRLNDFEPVSFGLVTSLTKAQVCYVNCKKCFLYGFIYQWFGSVSLALRLDHSGSRTTKIILEKVRSNKNIRCA